MDNLTRRRRVGIDGNWEYECNECEKWLPKEKFRGCVDKVDAYGNCLMCRSCISVEAHKVRDQRERKLIDKVLIGMGYDVNSDIPVHKQFEKKLKEKYNYE